MIIDVKSKKSTEIPPPFRLLWGNSSNMAVALNTSVPSFDSYCSLLGHYSSVNTAILFCTWHFVQRVIISGLTEI